MPKFSPSTLGFYFEENHGGSVPPDSVEVSVDDWLALTQNQSIETIIAANDEGYPVRVARPAPTNDELASRARSRRDYLLSSTQWMLSRHREQIDSGSSPALSEARYAELLTWRQSLRDWPASKGFPTSDPPAAPSFVVI